jgi:hypothetical protein
MKVRFVAVPIAVLFALTGCSANAPDAGPVGSDRSSSATDAPATAQSAVPLPVETPTETATPTPEPTVTSVPLNARGNRPKAIGELAWVTKTEDLSSPMVFSLVVTAITVDPPCTSGYADAPKNGHYVAIAIDLTTTPELATNEYFQSVSLSEYDIKVLSPDGVLENDSSGNAYSCLDSSETLSNDVGPGQRAVGSIVVDTANTHGAIVVTFGGSPSGWEYSF